jgi:cell wall-associated NlpC family hydrolase
MLPAVLVARPSSRPSSLPRILGLAAALLVLTAAPASAQGPGGVAAQSGSEAPEVATPGAASQPAVGGLAPGTPVTALVEGDSARITGVQAQAPAGAPAEVVAAIAAANAIAGLPYKWGGGHGSFADSGYDCSGAVSHVLHAAETLDDPLDSGALRRWGLRGKGEWITVYTNRGHAYVVIAGLRFDTSGRGGKGPRWRAEPRSSSGFTARHPEGL